MRFLLALLALTAVCAFAHEDHHAGHEHLNGLRFSRHIHTSFEDFAKEHLDWLSDEEKAEVKKLHDENKEKAREKVLEILEASTGDKKAKGVAQLQAACRELIVGVLGEDTAKELKQLKESGKTTDEIDAKVTELLNAVTDEQKKAKALEHKYVCKKVYSHPVAASKKRRSAHHDLESKLKSEWNWLTAEQKDEIRKLKTDGKSDEALLTKVFEYFKTADDKSVAEDGLQTSCGGAVLTILGAEKAEELKAFMANGAKPEAYEAKVKELLSSAPQKTLTKNQESCKLVFTSASRKRRHEGHHHKTLEEYLESSHLDWLTKEQKDELLQLKKDGKGQPELQAKVLEYYEATTGETKEKATAGLKSGCREILTHLLSEEQNAEIKKLHESGASVNDISAKVTEFVNGLTDEQKKAGAEKYKAGCKKIFGITSRLRKRRNQHHHTLEEGKSKEVIQKQVLEYYDSTRGDLREKATADLQAGCRELFSNLIGPEKTAAIKQLKESGATNDELIKKGNEFVDQIEDEQKKNEAKFYAVGCRKVFGVDSKRKRHVHNHVQKREAHSLEDLFKTYLSWLTEDQQKKLTELKNEGKTREELQKEVLNYYEQADAATKETAKQKMQDGCRKLLTRVLGEEKANEIKALRESGTPIKDIADKTTQWIAALTDENVKKSAQEYSTVCNKAFNIE